jgi:hypothetical protein
VPFAKHQKDEFELLRAMREPRIKPLSAIRPDLPEPLLEALARALEPEATKRTITAAELADVVRADIDVEAGCRELAELLESWKAMLERTVKRAPDQVSESSGGRAEHTLRYEEVALAFDDEASPDGPTFEAHALPSDSAVLIALPLAKQESLPSTVPPAAPRPVPPPSRRPSWGVILVFGAFITVGLLAALLATFAR